MNRKRASGPETITPPPAIPDPGIRSAAPPVERRQGRADRRIGDMDRRDPDRLQDEIVPRRNPDQADRRRR